MSQYKIGNLEEKLGNRSEKIPNKKKQKCDVYNGVYLNTSSELKSFAAKETSLSSYGVNGSEGDVITDET
jgi:hypothetical protein